MPDDRSILGYASDLASSLLSPGEAEAGVVNPGLVKFGIRSIRTGKAAAAIKRGVKSGANRELSGRVLQLEGMQERGIIQGVYKHVTQKNLRWLELENGTSILMTKEGVRNLVQNMGGTRTLSELKRQPMAVQIAKDEKMLSRQRAIWDNKEGTPETKNQIVISDHQRYKGQASATGVDVYDYVLVHDGPRILPFELERAKRLQRSQGIRIIEGE